MLVNAFVYAVTLNLCLVNFQRKQKRIFGVILIKVTLIVVLSKLVAWYVATTSSIIFHHFNIYFYIYDFSAKSSIVLFGCQMFSTINGRNSCSGHMLLLYGQKLFLLVCVCSEGTGRYSVCISVCIFIFGTIRFNLFVMSIFVLFIIVLL